MGDVEAAVDLLGNIIEHHYNAKNQCTDQSSIAMRAVHCSRPEIFDDFLMPREMPATSLDREGLENVH